METILIVSIALAIVFATIGIIAIFHLNRPGAVEFIDEYGCLTVPVSQIVSGLRRWTYENDLREKNIGDMYVTIGKCRYILDFTFAAEIDVRVVTAFIDEQGNRHKVGDSKIKISDVVIQLFGASEDAIPIRNYNEVVKCIESFFEQ